MQSSSQIITTNKPTSSFFTGRMPFLSPNQQSAKCQSTEWKNIAFHGLAYPKLTWGLPTLSLTTNSSWFLWGRVTLPLISPLMPVPLIVLYVDILSILCFYCCPCSALTDDDNDICLTAVFQDNWISRYQDASILDFIGAKDGGGDGDNWSYKTCKAPVKSSPPTNQHPAF